LGQRIITLDLLRGYFLFVILIDHLARWPGFFELLTGRGWLWASAAEGFFIISGIMVGVVRGKEMKQGKWLVAWKRLWSRGLVLYLWSISLTLLFTFVGYWLSDYAGIKPGIAEGLSNATLLWQTLTLQYVYGWADFLPWYAVFMIAAPLALWLVYKRLAWLVVLISVLSWWMWRDTNSYFAWQILFFIGLVGGYYLQYFETVYARVALPVKKKLMIWLSGISIITLMASWSAIFISPTLTNHQDFGLAWMASIRELATAWANLANPWFGKWAMSPGRVLLSFLWFITLYLVIRYYETTITRWVGKFLLPLGRNSLFVYGFQSIVIFAVAILIPYTTSFVWNLLINVICLALMWFVAKLWQKYRQRIAT